MKPITVFLAGIIQGSLVEATIHDQDWRTPVTRALASHLPHATIYCHYTQHPNSITYDLPAIRKVFDQGLQRARECELMIAYLPEASMGTAIEMHEAAASGRTIVAITPMDANWVVRTYSDCIVPDINAFTQFAASGQLAALVASKTRSEDTP
jgi:hypothetical protein